MHLGLLDLIFLVNKVKALIIIILKNNEKPPSPGL